MSEIADEHAGAMREYLKGRAESPPFLVYPQNQTLACQLEPRRSPTLSLSRPPAFLAPFPFFLPSLV